MSNVLEILGFLLIVSGLALWCPWVAMVAAGALLVAAAQAMPRRPAKAPAEGLAP